MAGKRAGGFSLGMTQRLGIAAAMLGDPPVLMLDEPVNGLDPEGIRWVRTFMRQLATEGRTIFVSSHLMSEMAVTADHLVVIGRGTLIANCSTEEFIQQSSERSVFVRAPDSARLRELITAEGGAVTDERRRPGRDRAARAPDRRTRRVRLGRAARAHPPAALARGGVHGDDGGQRRVRPGRARPGPARRIERVMSVGLLTAEWTKIRSVRSTLWSLLAFMVVAIGFSALIIIVISNTWNSPGNHPNHVRLLEDPTAVLFGAGFGLGQLAICVLGVIVMSSEYSTGAIRASLLAVPRRLPMLAAKAIVFALLDLVVSAITVFAVFFITTAIIRSHVSITLSQPGIARACIGGILYLTVLGLFSLAIGGLIRHTAGAISAVIALVLVVPPLVSLIPGTIANHIHGYLPNVAGQLVAQSSQQAGDVLSPWQGFGVFCIWTAVLLAACGWLLVRRDA